MSKYSEEFKLKVINYYLDNHYGWEYVAKQFDIPAWTTVRKWVRKYEEHGCKGLVKNQKTSYSGKFKQNVVEYMHNNHLSATMTATKFNLANEVTVLRWEHIYYEKGPQALYQSKRGRPRKMNNSKPEKKKLNKDVEEDLIAEVQHLRMENEYLKKLNALVQERIKRENKKK